MFNLPLVTISPNDYPNFNSELGVNNYRPHPGDLNRFLAFQGQAHFGAGYHERYNNPMLAAPNSEGIAGTIYFQNDVNRDDFSGALRLLEIKDPPGAPKEFVVYSTSSQKPGEEQYLRQLRIVSHFAMRHEFHTVKDNQKSKLPTHKISMEQLTKTENIESIWILFRQIQPVHITYARLPQHLMSIAKPSPTPKLFLFIHPVFMSVCERLKLLCGKMNRSKSRQLLPILTEKSSKMRQLQLKLS